VLDALEQSPVPIDRPAADSDGGLVAAARLAPLLGLTAAKMTNRSDS
jgi:hypothetical protein